MEESMLMLTKELRGRRVYTTHIMEEGETL
jgi:hypothetical protein